MPIKTLSTLVACLIWTSSAVAGLSQSNVSSTTGFVGAYGGLQTGSNPNPGNDIEPHYQASDFNSDESTFITGSGSASANTSYTGPLGTNSASGTASAGMIKTLATNSASNAGFSAGSVSAGWNDSITINGGGAPGSDGIWLFSLNVSGTLAATGFAGNARAELGAWKDNMFISNNVVGYDTGNSDPLSTSAQFVQWSVSSFGGSFSNESRIINDSVTFALPFTFGEAFTLGVHSFTTAGKRSSSGVAGTSTSNMDFLSTILWALRLASA